MGMGGCICACTTNNSNSCCRSTREYNNYCILIVLVYSVFWPLMNVYRLIVSVRSAVHFVHSL